MAQAGPIELHQKEIDYVTFEIDPETRAITRVDLPPFKSEYDIIYNRRCEKIDNDKHTRQDCSSTGHRSGTFSTQLPTDEEREEIAATGPTMVSGKCRTPHSGKYEQRTSDYEWEFHRE
jgi:hypothetical protein